MISGIAAVQDVLKVLFETELGVKISEISLEDRLLLFRHTINLGSVFSGEYGPGEYDHLGFFRDLLLILHLAHHNAKFRRPC